MLCFKLFILICLTILKGCLFQPQCPTFPNGKIEEKLIINIVGDPKVFIPISTYTVKLRSNYEFEKFIITLEGDNGGGGSLQILNGIDVTFAEDCLGTVVETTTNKKKEVQVLWTTPKYGCTTIKVGIGRQDKWVINNKTLCSGEIEKQEKRQECCSCDHARYKITFEGLWSPESHPKDFPTSLWLTHFSDVIGASHIPNFTMWAEGGLATYGLKQLAEYGIVREMENELRLQSTKLRSIVKAAGLWYPDLNGKTSAVLRTDPRRHLLSLASMFGPSPDWIVGVSSLNLCLENCTWLEHMELDLYPYDAGTDSGRTYMSIKTATDPPERIRKITTKFPDDPRSPFYNPNSDEMPPLAKLYIERDQIIPKLCSDLTEKELLQQVTESENTEDENRPDCMVTEYSSWSPCSVTCGKGLRSRVRFYINPSKAQKSKCDRQLVSKEMCTAAEKDCLGDLDEEEIVPLVSAGECEVTDWTEWSECSVTCGIGIKIRSRNFLSTEPNVIKKCMHITTSEMEKCMLPQCHLNEKKISRACSVTEWSIWSPCSVSCGNGLTTRVRQFLSKNRPSSCSHQVNLTQSLTCSAPNCTVDQANYKEICSSEPLYGPCRGNFTRWAYSEVKGKCETFPYGGCRGNKNNFMTEEDCEKACSPATSEKKDVRQDDVVNCVVSKWSNWSFCTPCTNGTKTKTRTIVKKTKNGGKPCPTLAKTIKCRVPKDFCEIMSSYS